MSVKIAMEVALTIAPMSLVHLTVFVIEAMN